MSGTTRISSKALPDFQIPTKVYFPQALYVAKWNKCRSQVRGVQSEKSLGTDAAMFWLDQGIV